MIRLIENKDGGRGQGDGVGWSGKASVLTIDTFGPPCYRSQCPANCALNIRSDLPRHQWRRPTQSDLYPRRRPAEVPVHAGGGLPERRTVANPRKIGRAHV